MSLIPAPAGRLEVLMQSARRREPDQATAVVCHPHPLHGGTMHTKAVHATSKGLLAAGVASLRFNFRGVGRSTGQHDHGAGEKGDVLAALDHLAAELPGAPRWIAGFSFGSWVGLEVGAGDPRVEGLIALAPPLTRYDFDYLLDCEKPKLILQGELDDLAPLSACEEFFEQLRPPKALVIFEGTGHLFLECLPELRHAVTAAARGWPPSGRAVIRPAGL